jgi:toxin ParE1/3/4
MPLRFHRAASAEAVAARDWYEHARRGLGATFVTEVERVVKLIEQYPSRFPFYTDGLRRASLRRFPFSIFFEEVDNVTYVWAIFHHRREILRRSNDVDPDEQAAGQRPLHRISRR